MLDPLQRRWLREYGRPYIVAWDNKSPESPEWLEVEVPEFLLSILYEREKAIRYPPKRTKDN